MRGSSGAGPTVAATSISAPAALFAKASGSSSSQKRVTGPNGARRASIFGAALAAGVCLCDLVLRRHDVPG